MLEKQEGNTYIYNTETICEFRKLFMLCFSFYFAIPYYFTVNIANMEGCRGAKLHHGVQKLALYIC